MSQDVLGVVLTSFTQASYQRFQGCGHFGQEGLEDLICSSACSRPRTLSHLCQASEHFSATQVSPTLWSGRPGDFQRRNEAVFEGVGIKV